MKHIFQKWREFLNEDLSTEEYFGQDFEKFYDAYNVIYNAFEEDKIEIGVYLEKITEMADKLFEELGAGMHRKVFQINSDRVIKVAHSVNGLKANKQEASTDYLARFREILPKVEFASPDHSWIVTEKLNVLDREKYSFGDAEHFYYDYFPAFHPEFPAKEMDIPTQARITDFKYRKSIYIPMADYAVHGSISQGALEDGLKRFNDEVARKEISKEKFKKLVKKAYKTMPNNFEKFVEFSKAYDVSFTEAVRYGNIAVDENGDLVLIDYNL